MTVLVKLSTTLRDHAPGYVPAKGLAVSLDGPATAEELAIRLNLPLDQIKIIMVNGAHASRETLLADGDRIGFFPAVGGG